MMVRLGDICTVVLGSTPKSTISEFWDGDVKWITPAELDDDSYIITDSARHITEIGVAKTGLKPFPAGTVILSSRAPIGKTAIAGCEMYCNQGFKNLICGEKIDNKYLYFFLSSKTEYLNLLGRGATFKEISKAIVEDIEIPLPPMDVQKAIAARFEKLMRLIRLRKTELEELDRLVKSRFVEMFGDPRDNSAGWLLLPLGRLFTVSSSKRVYQREQVDDGVPFLRISDLMQRIEEGTETAELFISQRHYADLLDAGLVPTPGDILVTSRGTLGCCYEVKKEDRFYFQDGMISWLHNRSKLVTNTYIIQLFQMPGFRVQIDEIPAGSTVNYLSLARLNELQVMCPPLDLQLQFAAFVTQVDKSKLAVQQGLQELEILKKSLMQQYFG